MAEPGEGTVRYERLREGLCPIHGSALERRDGDGWCTKCGIGWSVSPAEVTVNIEPDLTGFGGLLKAMFGGKPEPGPPYTHTFRPDPPPQWETADGCPAVGPIEATTGDDEVMRWFDADGDEVFLVFD